MPDPTDDPEIIEHLTDMGWTAADPIPSLTRLAAYGVIRRDGRVLLCRVAPGNLGEGLWMLPGGGLESGEAPEDAAIREVEEETGLVARITGQPSIHSDTGVWPFSTGPVASHQVRFVYSMEVIGGVERREVDGSTDEFGWFTPDELGALALADLVARVLAAEAPVQSASSADASSA